MPRLLAPLIASVLLLACAAPALAMVNPGTPRHHAHAHHWRVRFETNFAKRLNPTIWTRYTGTPRCCTSTRWSPSHVVVKRGVLHLANYAQNGRWVSAGVSMGRSVNQTYGKWSVRFRMARGAGVGMCIGLWPKQGWPPEIDFAEESSTAGSRHVETGTLHHGAGNRQNHASVRANFTHWHVMSVVWTRHKLVYLLDGKRWHAVGGSAVPHQPMHLMMQTHVGSNGVSGVMPQIGSNRHVDLQIDWVHIYRPRR